MKTSAMSAMAVAIATALPVLAEPGDEVFYVKPGSSAGCIAIINQQKAVEDAPFLGAIGTLREYSRYVVKFTRDARAAEGATVVLNIVDEPANPAPMTVSPEIGRGTLNVAALTNDLKSATSVRKFLPKRARLELLRLLCYAFGVGGSQFSGNVLSAVSIRELDYMPLTLPVDALDKLEKSAKKRGMKPEVVADYYAACEEGWAFAPTNAYQKAIWDKVHTIPKNPMKIEFDPKKGR